MGEVRLADSEKVHEVSNYQGAQFGPASLKTVTREYCAGERKEGDSSQSSLVGCCTERGSWTNGKFMRHSCLVI